VVLGVTSGSTQDLSLTYGGILLVKAEKTRQAYMLGLRTFLRVNGFPDEYTALKVMRRRGADEYLLRFVSGLQSRGLAPKSIWLYLTGVRAWLELHDVKYTAIKLRRFLPRKEVVKETRPIRRNEVRLLLGAIHPSKKLALWTMWACGLRVQECMNLRISDLDLESEPPRLYVQHSKTVSGRRICFIPGDLAKALKEHVRGRDPDDYLFPSEKGPGYKMHHNRFRESFYGALKRAGLLRRDASGRGWIYSPHSLRRGFETELLSSGAPPIVVSILMGHDLGVTQSYYKPTERELAETWRKYENSLRLDYEDLAPAGKVAMLEERIEALEEALATYEKIFSRLSQRDPMLLKKLGLRGD
jgi:integrase/recombinase XerD